MFFQDLRKVMVVGVFLICLSASVTPATSSMNSRFSQAEQKISVTEPVHLPVTDPSWQWVTRGGGTSSEMISDHTTDADGNIYITGYFTGTALFGTIILTSSGSLDVFVVKLNATGAWQWAAKAGGFLWDESESICVDAAGNCYITGNFEGTALFGPYSITSSGDADVFVAKLNPSGVWQWAKSAGGIQYDKPYDICVDSAGNTYLTGAFTGTATFGSHSLVSTGLYDVFVASLNTQGTWLWAVKGGGADGDAGTGICRDAQGNLYITGAFSQSASFGSIPLVSSGEFDVFVASLSSTGVWQWAVRAGGTSDELGRALCIDTDGNLYITGEFYGATMFGSTSLPFSGIYDLFVAKLSAGGTWLWAVSAGGPYADIGTRIATDGHSNVYVTGGFQGTALFGTTSLTSSGLYDICAMRLTRDGVWRWAVRAGGAEDDVGLGISVDDAGGVIISGYFKATALFGSYEVTSWGSHDVFVAKLAQSNNPPLPPVIHGPTIGNTGESLLFEFSGAVDPDDDTLYFWVDWGDGSGSAWIGPFASGEPLIGSHAWAQPGVYGITAKVKDDSGFESPWSEPFFVQIVTMQQRFLLGFITNVQQYENDYMRFTPVLLLMFPSDNFIYTQGSILLQKGYQGYLGGVFVLAQGNTAVLS